MQTACLACASSSCTARALTLVYFSTDSVTCTVLVSDLFPVSVSACLTLTPMLHPGGSARAMLGANTGAFSFSCMLVKDPFVCAMSVCTCLLVWGRACTLPVLAEPRGQPRGCSLGVTHFLFYFSLFGDRGYYWPGAC